MPLMNTPEVKLFTAFTATAISGCIALMIHSTIDDKNTPPVDVDPSQATCRINVKDRQLEIVNTAHGDVTHSTRIFGRQPLDGTEKVHFKLGPSFASGTRYTIDFENRTCMIDKYANEHIYHLQEPQFSPHSGHAP